MTRSLRPSLILVGLALLTSSVLAQSPRDVEVRFTSAGATLAGTLTLPPGPGPHPAVILISGSGPQDRDGAIPGIDGYRPFAEIASALSNAGIAVLRYDDRGAGASTGVNLTATTGDLADDTQAALRFVQRRPDIDPLQVGLVGHSEGALIAPMLASRDPGVAFFVALAPPMAEPIEGLVTQERRMLEAAGTPPGQLAGTVATTRRMLELNVASDWGALEALLRSTAKAQLEAMPAERRAAFGDDANAALDALVAPAMAQQRTWMHWFVTHDPAPYWRAVRVPALAIFGDHDVQVDLGQHRGALEGLQASAGLEQVDITTIAGANHLFLKARTGGVQEYGELDPKLMPELLDALRGWTLEHVSLPSSS